MLWAPIDNRYRSGSCDIQARNNNHCAVVVMNDCLPLPPPTARQANHSLSKVNIVIESGLEFVAVAELVTVAAA